MKPKGYHLLTAFLLLLSGCVAGPVETARQYDRELRNGNAASLARASSSVDASTSGALAEAIREGNHGVMPADVEWDTLKATARIEVGTAFYLLFREGDAWKVRCASVGPYHDQTPEMTLLLALHHIRLGNFQGFKRLLATTLPLSSDPIPEDFEADLRLWADWLRASTCRPFERRGERAELLYQADGLTKRLVLVQQQGRWRIESLW